jgi:anti-sigma regulatory factor (Ser/Thr protein kinase)/PAS domain-containing protein
VPAAQAEDRHSGPARLRCELPAAPLSVRELRHAAVDFARAHGADERTAGDIALAVTEAATNAVLHAFVGRPSGTICVVGEPLGGALLIRVVDDGRGMQPRPDSPGLGMGLPTIGKLAARVDLREGPGGRGTEVRMVFAAPGVGGAPEPLPEGDRLALLAEVGRLAEGPGWPARGLDELAGLLVPRWAAACAIELLDGAGSRRRLAALGEEEPPEALLTAALAAAGVEARDGWVAAPLRTGERVGGVVALEAGTTPDADALVALVAERIAGGVATTRLLERLERGRRRFERILGGLAEAITVHDEEGRTVYANDAAVVLLGAASREEVLAAPPDELAGRFLITREDGSPVGVDDFPGARALAGHDAPPLLTLSVRRSTGRAFWLLTKTSLLDDEDGRFAVNVIEDVTEAKESERRLRVLAEAGALLAGAGDLDAVMAGVAQLPVPVLADWCAVDLLDDAGTLYRAGLAHVDPAKVALGRRLHERYPPDHRELLAAGEPLLVPEITDAMLEEGAVDAEHLAGLREVGMRSAMLVPLCSAGRTLGLLTLVSAESRRVFGPGDLAFAEDLARRAAVAVDVARLRRSAADRVGD